MPPLSYIHASEAARTTAGGEMLAARGGWVLRAHGGDISDHLGGRR